MNKTIEYNSDIDSIYIYKTKKDVIGSITLGNFVIDVDLNGSVIGLEIDNASEVMGIEPSLLLECKEGKIEVFVHNNMLIVRYLLIYGDAQKYLGMCAIPQNKITINN